MYQEVLYWSRLLDWKNQTLTPNPDVIYLMPFFNTKDAGPVVLEIPPADDGLINGSIMNYWQAAIEDVGPGGVAVPATGIHSSNNSNYMRRLSDPYTLLYFETEILERKSNAKAKMRNFRHIRRLLTQ